DFASRNLPSIFLSNLGCTFEQSQFLFLEIQIQLPNLSLSTKLLKFFLFNDGFHLFLFRMRNKSQSQFQSSLPAGFLFRGRKQGNPFVFIHRLHQVPSRRKRTSSVHSSRLSTMGNPA
uniref:Uncharacterized protein n=1 Tax=Cucumis melo TaxID=3656 RepID=A0A9I9D6X2_CUCME